MTTPITRKLLTQYYVTSASTFVGEPGTIFFDPATTTLRFGDGTTPGGNVGGIYVLGAVTLTSAQILTATTSPVQIVQAPPVGSAIIVTDGVYICNAGTITYSGGGLGLFYEGGGEQVADLGDGDIMSSSVSAVTPLTGLGINSPTMLFTNISGMGLVYGDSSSNPYTDGNGTLRIIVYGFVTPLT